MNTRTGTQLKSGYVITEFDENMLSSRQVTSTIEEIEKQAYKMAEFIDSTGRVPLSIEYFRRRYDSGFQPDCWYLNNDNNNITDTEYSSRDVKNIEGTDIDNIHRSKIMCSQCPLQQSCLAVGLASKKNTRRSKNEKAIPQTEEKGQAVILNDFCIYGGFTPGERRIMYNIVCYILEQKDLGVWQQDKNS